MGTREAAVQVAQRAEKVAVVQKDTIVLPLQEEAGKILLAESQRLL